MAFNDTIRSRITARSTLALGLMTALAAAPLAPALADAPPTPQLSAPLPSFAPIVDRVLPAVVNISVTEKSDASPVDDDDDQAAPDQGPMPGMPGPGTPFDQFLRRFFEQQQPNGMPRQTPHGPAMALGSGFIIDPSGYVVTNNHVVGSAEKVTVILQDGSEHPARIVGKDAKTDLALVKIETNKPLPYVQWGDSDKTKVGDWVLAVGNPFGLGGTVTNGILSARSRSIGDSSYVDFMQIDAAVNRGNSGGPTFDLEGHVVGINTAIYSPNGGNVGIAFDIPSDTAKAVIEQLKASGKVARGYLGVEIQQITPDLAAALGLDADHPKGALVANVTPNGPAAKAGIQSGDVIQTLDGKEIEKMQQLPLLVAEIPAGKEADLGILRHGKVIDVHATIGKLDEAKLASAGESGEPAKAAALGVTLGALTPDAVQRLGLADGTDGALITRVAPNGPAADAGLEAGDVIRRVNGQEVHEPAQARQVIAAATSDKTKPILLLIDRHGAEQFVAVAPKGSEG
jgi:serine protease Do